MIVKPSGVQEDSRGLRRFSVHRSLWRMFMNSCVGSSALEQVRGSVPERVHQNVTMASIQKIFTTAQSPILNLHEDEFCVLTEEVDSTQSSRRSCSFIDRKFTSNYQQKCTSSAIPCCVSAENGNLHPRSGEMWETQRNADFVSPSRTFSTPQHRRRASSVRVEDVPRTHNGSTSLRNSDDARE